MATYVSARGVPSRSSSRKTDKKESNSSINLGEFTRCTHDRRVYGGLHFVRGRTVFARPTVIRYYAEKWLGNIFRRCRRNGAFDEPIAAHQKVRSERGLIENGTRRRVRLTLVTGGQHGATVSYVPWLRDRFSHLPKPIMYGVNNTTEKNHAGDVGGPQCTECVECVCSVRSSKVSSSSSLG